MYSILGFMSGTMIQTCIHFIPKVKKRLNFWKPLALPVLSKAGVIEIFHASKLWYAASFYPIPTHFEKEINEAFMDYVTFPKNKIEVSKMEMEKERGFGGIKLINTQLKAATPKIHWLMRLVTDKNLHMHLKIFSLLIGEQKGGLVANDVLFAEQSYIKNHLKCSSSFYIEALLGMSKLDTWKHVPDIHKEHLYYNRIFSVTDDDDENIEEKTIKPFQGNKQLCTIRTYGDILTAETTFLPPKLNAVIKKKIESIKYIRPNVADNEIRGYDSTSVLFQHVTQKYIYTELIHQKSTDHIYQYKWLENEDIPAIDWDKVWEFVHQQYFTEEMKSTIWEQIHLNFYTAYNYNKWHNSLNPCPFCRKIPEDVFHILLHCTFATYIWDKIENTLMKILPVPLSSEEKAFGIQPRLKRETNACTLRNWITFSLRHHFMTSLLPPILLTSSSKSVYATI